ncbi:HAD family hydrolase [Rhodospirillum sp. A1_3_36]|uniref:HAD family hydrolase n=1 Tax=Rhodospirillum sp. A1_3_36 TaxID=3391666 RepID=UPI0039A4298C
MSGVLFDLDQTLLDRDGSLDRFLSWQWRTDPIFQGIPEERFKAAFVSLDANGTVWKDRVYLRLLDLFGLPWEAVPPLLETYLFAFAQYAQPVSGCREALRSLKARGISLGIVTNGREDLQSAVIAALGLDDLMDVVVILEEAGVKKPDPRIFSMALDRLALSAPECVFVGDHPESDIRGAKAVGMRALWRKTHWFPPPDPGLVDGIITDLGEVVEAIDLLPRR